MKPQKAFVFDTNFIIQIKDLEDVVSKLQDKYVVYVTQVSIDERIAQQCRELKQKYNDLDKLQVSYAGIASIKQVCSYEQRASILRTTIQGKYKSLFGDHIIPFHTTEHTLGTVIERVHARIPPFSSADHASDKGFKDTLIWLSLLDYFSKCGEDEIVFVTSDAGFRNASESLIREFGDRTGKKLTIEENSYYNRLLEEKTEKKKVKDVPPVDMSKLREQIQEVAYAITYAEVPNYWGGSSWEQTFSISAHLVASDIESWFLDLEAILTQHIFDQDVCATEVFRCWKNVNNGGANISINALEEMKKVYSIIQKHFPEDMVQFYETVATLFNRAYVQPAPSVSISEELPF